MLGNLLKIQSVLTVLVVGAGAYYILKKRSEKKSLAAVKVDSDKLTLAKAECEKQASTMKFSEGTRETFISGCVDSKLKA